MQTVTLEQLIALNREISALAAAGVPLAEGLVRVANDFDGPTSALAQRLTDRLVEGKTLSEALDAEGDKLPESYRAIVKAGLQSGRLTSALEGYTNTATRIVELRRVAGLAMLYPVMLLIVIWVLFLVFCNFVLPKFDWLGINDQLLASRLRWSVFEVGGIERWLLWLLLPVGLLAIAWLWWRRTSSTVEAGLAGRRSWLSWIPGIRRVQRLSCEANFAELLSLLVDQRIPLPEALRLAATGSGLQAVSASTQALITHVESGKPLGTKTAAFQQLPPLVRLALLSNKSPEKLSTGLKRAADTYHERAQSWSQSVSFYLPIGATALIGGTTVAGYSLLLLQPYVAMLHEVLNWW